MKYIAICIISFFHSQCLAQIIVKPAIIINPIKQKFEKINLESEKAGVKFLKTDFSDCDNDDPNYDKPYRLLKRIVSKKIKGDTLSIEIAFADTCFDEFESGVQVINDSTINLIYQKKDEMECMCCYGMVYHLKIKNRKDYEFRLNGNSITLTKQQFHIEPVAKKDSLFYYDKIGQRQGIVNFKTSTAWLEYVYKDDKKIIERRFFPNGKVMREIYPYQGLWISYYPSGQIRFVQYDSKNGLNIEYYENGVKAKECLGGMWEENNCTYWDKNGNLVKK